MIRVLHVIDSLDLGGAQTVLVNLARFRDRASIEMEVATMHGRGVFADAVEKEGVPVHSLSGTKFPPGYLLSLPRLLRYGHYSVIHFHLFGSNWIGKPLAALCGQRVIVNHDHCNDRVRAASPAATLLDAATNKLSSHIYAVSRSTRDDLIRREKIEPWRISYLANGVDTNYYAPADTKSRQSARDQLNLSQDGLLVTGLGRLHPQKNWPLFLRVAERFPNVRFIIAGTGPEECELHKILADRKISNVTLVGFRDTRAVLAATDLFLLTSDYEGMPMTLLEAMSSEVPCIVSGVDGCLEVLGDGVGGATAQPQDVDDFVLKLRPYIESAELRRQQGAAARAKVLSSFNARNQVREIESLYAKLLAEAGN